MTRHYSDGAMLDGTGAPYHTMTQAQRDAIGEALAQPVVADLLRGLGITPPEPPAPSAAVVVPQGEGALIAALLQDVGVEAPAPTAPPAVRLDESLTWDERRQVAALLGGVGLRVTR